KQIANATCTYTNKHFHKFRSSHREKSYISFPGCCSSQKCFSSTSRSNHQNAFGSSGSHSFVFNWVTQKIDNFGKFLFGLINPCHVSKSYLWTIFVVKLGS